MKLMIPATDALSVAINDTFGEIAETLDGWSDYGVYSTSVNLIPHEAYDGFFPYTNGGFVGCANVQFQDAKEHWTCLAPYVANDDEMFYDELRSKIRTQLDEEDILDETVFDALADDTLYEHFNEEFEEFEQEWRDADSDVFFLGWRACFFATDNPRNKSGEDEIYFFAAVNVDFNYGRDGKGNEAVTWEQDVKVSECTPEKLDEIKKAIIKLFQDA